jgi:hypothetical protein
VAVMAERWVIGDLGARVITRLSVDPAANGTAPVSSKFKRLVRCREHRLVIWKRCRWQKSLSLVFRGAASRSQVS